MAIYGEPFPELDRPFRSIGGLLRDYGARHPDKTALYDLDAEIGISWGRLHEEANRVARWLDASGIGKGDRVGLLSDESIEKLILWLGIWRRGAVVCPLNVELNAGHIAELLRTIGPKLVLWDEALDGPALTEGVGAPSRAFGAWREEGGEGLFAEIAGVPAAPELEDENAAEDMACIFCTSGTTAKPKCVVYNHLSYWLSGLSTLDMLGLGPDDRTLEYRSFGWNSAQVLSLMPWLETGLTLHIARRFSHSRFFDWIKRHGITFAAGVPTVVNMLLNEPTGVTAKDVPTLRLMTCSTAPLSPEQWTRFEEMYGVTLLQLYGMSEAGWICGNRHNRRRMGTVGPPARYQQFLIVDQDGQACPPGVEGEVSIGGPQACMATISPEGAWEDQAGMRIRTGDLAVMDEDGFVRVTGRTKDLIIRGGVNIAPLEIDNAVAAHPAVLEAAAVGVPDPVYGEEIVCYVVPRAGETLSAEAVRRHCAAALPAFKVPREVRLVEALPKSDRGKVRREALREIWLAERAAS